VAIARPLTPATAPAPLVPAAPPDVTRAGASPAAPALVRPHVRGKFLFAGDDKLYVRGVIYGAFRPDAEGREYQDLDVIERDFARMAANGINVVRIPHTTPPRSLLDAAQRHGLRVMVGLSAEQYLGFLVDRKKTMLEIEALVRANVRRCADHPAMLCYALGNEIPSPMARWVGRRTIERYLERLSRAVKEEDPGALVTYVNYPTTEYLRLPFLDLVCFNVYLESQEPFEAYLARLQNIAGERPLIMSELGLDGLRNGESLQAQSLAWQVRTAYAAGCAGVFVFSWTDEWYRNSHDVDDWGFGLTRADRSAKPALHAVREAFAGVPFSRTLAWPRVSVIVCTYNGARTLHDCLRGLERLAYPDYEVIVVDDGSTDATADIARHYACRLIRTENRGLASARNTGLEAASGEIVAYIDDDAHPDPHWLTYLAATFMTTTHAGVGGPNLPPAGDGPIAECVASAPGGPVHVLLSDREAEHIPGCNMAFRAARLRAIGGFDPQFRIAGDDVDVCWQLQAQGWTLGFNPAAVVWHHRRNSVRAYWKQQRGYGRAEALLEAKWPEKYNSAGHLSWAGRVYGNGLTRACFWRRGRIYQGTWGMAPFQALYQPASGLLSSLSLMPEWYLIIAALGGVSFLGFLWRPALLALLPLAVAIGISLAQASVSAAEASFASAFRSRLTELKLRGLTAFLHLLQPLARLRGRLRHGLSPWRWRGALGLALPRPRTVSVWVETWRDPAQRVRSLELALQVDGIVVNRGGDYDHWDLDVRGGMLGRARLLVSVEEHGRGRQYVRFRWWPKCSTAAPTFVVAFATLSVIAGLDGTWMVSGLFAATALILGVRTVLECATATAGVVRAIKASAPAGR
jgi:GT2 family glycosyltransferase